MPKDTRAHAIFAMILDKLREHAKRATGANGQLLNLLIQFLSNPAVQQLIITIITSLLTAGELPPPDGQD